MKKTTWNKKMNKIREARQELEDVAELWLGHQIETGEFVTKDTADSFYKNMDILIKHLDEMAYVIQTRIADKEKLKLC